jgi:NADPH:quinone reductase-like Zn-dependent oxidoreductase
MRAIRLHQVGGSESLRYEEAPTPSPKDNQVLVQIYATAITPTEFAWYPTLHIREGGTRPFPIILGHEFSGVVDTIGSACTGVQVGDPVYGLSD